MEICSAQIERDGKVFARAGKVFRELSAEFFGDFVFTGNGGRAETFFHIGVAAFQAAAVGEFQEDNGAFVDGGEHWAKRRFDEGDF